LSHFALKPQNFALQQSHHCGIETAISSKPSHTARPQQSHHCGIETLPLPPADRLPLPAAIAPLWD